MASIVRSTATAITLSGLPTFNATNSYPLSRIRTEVQFAIAHRLGELEAVNGPLINNWINDAYTQILGMLENNRTTFSDKFTLPALTETIALPADVDQIHHLSVLTLNEKTFQLHKIVDIENWRGIERDDQTDNTFDTYFMQRDNSGLLVQFRAQTEAKTIQIDGLVRPPILTADTQCPALDDALCLGLVELSISIAMRRFGEFTYAGTQNNAALGIIRSHIDTKGKDRRGTIAAVSRPRTLEEARRLRAT